MIKVEDTSLIYKTKRYYRTRINKLIDTKYVKKYKNYIYYELNTSVFEEVLTWIYALGGKK